MIQTRGEKWETQKCVGLEQVYADDRQLSITDDDESDIESSKVNVMDMWNKDASCVSFRVDVF